MLEESCIQEGRCEASKCEKERKTGGVRAHPAPSAPLKLPLPTITPEKRRGGWRRRYERAGDSRNIILFERASVT